VPGAEEGTGAERSPEAMAAAMMNAGICNVMSIWPLFET